MCLPASEFQRTQWKVVNRVLGFSDESSCGLAISEAVSKCRRIAGFSRHQPPCLLGGCHLVEPGHPRQTIPATWPAEIEPIQFRDCDPEERVILAMPHDSILINRELTTSHHLRELEHSDWPGTAAEFIEYAIRDIAPQMICRPLGDGQKNAVSVTVVGRAPRNDNWSSHNGALAVSYTHLTLP